MQRKEKNALQVYALCVKDDLDASVHPYLHLFDAERRANILKYRCPADQNRTMWAELLARFLLCRKLAIPWENIALERDKRGKPYGKTPEGRIEISLAHSGSWVLCSIGGFPNGVDVEMDTEAMDEVAAASFSPEEIAALQVMHVSVRRISFLCCWTIKESYLKCTGEGLFGDLSKINCADILKGNGLITGKNFLLPDGAIVAVCTQGDQILDGIDFISIKTMKDYAPWETNKKIHYMKTNSIL